MVEYLYDCIRATAGTDIVIAARITDDNDLPITEDCWLMIHEYDGQDIIEAEGDYVDDTWYYSISAEHTKGLNGHYWYCFKHGDTQLCFKQPIYFI